MFKLFLFLFICLLPGLSVARAALQVFVSIPPHQYLVERIGQDRVEVRVMLKPGDSPETFDPTLKQIGELNSAQLYFRIGMAFEEKWVASIENNKTKTVIIDCCADILKLRSAALDNHVWTSVRNAFSLSALIKQELIKIDPDHALHYENNYMVLIAELEQLDIEIVEILRQRRTDYFIISHAALGHFADDYGLIQLSFESLGREVGARGLVKLIRQARQENIQTLFIEKQHKSAAAKAFANEINATIIEIDLLKKDYLNNLRNITKLLAGATH